MQDDGRDIHLMVLIHGLWGTPSHLSVLESTAQAVAEDNPNELQFRTFKPKSNSGVKTYDGVDVCASREAFEVEAEVARLEHEAGNGRKVKEISVAGYSCGGLIARYMIGILHARSFFSAAHCQPRSLSLIATPHLGIIYHKGHKKEWISKTIGWRLLGRIGSQILCKDGPCRDGRGGLLDTMCQPESIFMEALNLFPHVTIFANAAQDQAVTYPSATFTDDDPFIELPVNHPTQLVVEVDEIGMVKGWHHSTHHDLQAQECDRLLGTAESKDNKVGTPPSKWIWAVGSDKKEKVSRRPGDFMLHPFLMFKGAKLMALMHALIPIIYMIGYPTAFFVFVAQTWCSNHRLSHLTTLDAKLSPSQDEYPPLQAAGMSPKALEVMFDVRARQVEIINFRQFSDDGVNAEVEQTGNALDNNPRRWSETTLVDKDDFLLDPTQSKQQVSPLYTKFDVTVVPTTETSQRTSLMTPKKEQIHDATLRFLPAQRSMIKNWSLGTSRRASPVKVHTTFLPQVKNSHAVICCRDLEGGIYPEQEVGVPIVRKWAEEVLAADAHQTAEM